MSEEKFTKGEWVLDESGNIKANGDILPLSGVSLAMYKSIEVDANKTLLSQAKNMYYALESINKELEWLINEINRLYKVNHDRRSLDEPERLDMETCHNNNVLLAKARGEL